MDGSLRMCAGIMEHEQRAIVSTWILTVTGSIADSKWYRAMSDSWSSRTTWSFPMQERRPAYIWLDTWNKKIERFQIRLDKIIIHITFVHKYLMLEIHVCTHTCKHTGTLIERAHYNIMSMYVASDPWKLKCKNIPNDQFVKIKLLEIYRYIIVWSYTVHERVIITDLLPMVSVLSVAVQHVTEQNNNSRMLNQSQQHVKYNLPTV